MALKAKGIISVSGFKLEPAEKALVDKILMTYEKKIGLRTGYKEIKLRLKKSKHGKAFLHEVQGTLMVNNDRFSTKTTSYNLFSAISTAFEKLMGEAEHKQRTVRQRK